MIPFPWRLLIFAVVVASAFLIGDYRGAGMVRDEWAKSAAIEAAQSATLRVSATDAVRDHERKSQEIYDAITRNLEGERDAIRARLSDDIERLRQRSARVVRDDPVPGAARADCAGASGAELSGQDAEFLVREAARADDIRAGLVACYGAIDAEAK